MRKVSVIIPTFNRAAKVANAVRSVLSQSLPADEVIVIDDGSTDATEEALAPWLDQIRYIRTENGGVSAARNKGILEAKCEFVAFLDSDDTWDKEKLSRQMACVIATGAKVCFCISADESGEPLDDLRAMDPSLGEHSDRFYPPGDCRFFKFQGHPFLQSMIAERQAILKAGSFDESLRVAEDTKLIYGLILDHGYSVVNEKMVSICREREGPGLSDTMDAESAFRRYDCYTRVQAGVFWRLVPLDPEAAAIVRSNMFYFASRQAEIACAMGREKVARRYARSGMDWKAGWKCNLRNLMILAAFGPARRRHARKWGCHSKGENINSVPIVHEI